MNHPLVHVEWQDAQSIDAWTAVDQMDGAPAKCITAGFLVAHSQETISVAGTIEGGNACCVMVIPRKIITKISTIIVGEEQQIGLGDNE